MSIEQRRAGSAAVAEVLGSLPELHAARKVAGYWPAPDEVDLRRLWEALHDRGVLVHLPRIHSGSAVSMDFVAWDPSVAMPRNRYGIPEPRGRPTEPSALEVVVLPCVAVDDHGARVGMGKGFYDRTLAGVTAEAGHPLLVGVAFESQRISGPVRIRTEAWDVTLDAVVTDSGIRRTTRDGP